MGQAQDRSAWRGITQDFCTTRCGTSEGFYEDLQFNLHGRCLVKDVDTFHFLMARHAPVEEPYECTFAEQHSETPIPGLWRLTTDGSSMKSPESLAVVRKPPALDQAAKHSGEVYEHWGRNLRSY